MNEILEQEVYLIRNTLLELIQLAKQPRKQIEQMFVGNHKILQKIFTLFFPDLDFRDIVVSNQQLNQILYRLVTVCRIKQLNQGQNITFNISDTFLFVLQGTGLGEVQLETKHYRRRTEDIEYSKSNIRSCMITQKSYDYSRGIKHIMSMKKVQHLPYETWRKIKIFNLKEQKIILLIVDQAIMERVKFDLLKTDNDCKLNFVNTNLFCDNYPPYSVKTLKLEKYKRGQEISLLPGKIYLLYQGILVVTFDDDTKNNTKFTLSKGSILSTDELMQQLKQQNSDAESNRKQKMKHYLVQENSLILTIPMSQFLKCMKNQSFTRLALLNKLICIQQNRRQITEKGKNAKDQIKKNKQGYLQVAYSIRSRKKSSKAFRKKSVAEQSGYEDFMSFDKYEKITKNKEIIEKKHKLYHQINNIIKQKQQEELYNKTIRIQQGFKKMKRNQLSVRLKQSRIDKLALKSCIQNISKFRQRKKDIQFYFEGSNKKNIPQASTFKRWISMQEVNERNIKTPITNNMKQNDSDWINQSVNKFNQIPQVHRKQKNTSNKSIKFNKLHSNRCSIADL